MLHKLERGPARLTSRTRWRSPAWSLNTVVRKMRRLRRFSMTPWRTKEASPPYSELETNSGTRWPTSLPNAPTPLKTLNQSGGNERKSILPPYRKNPGRLDWCRWPTNSITLVRSLAITAKQVMHCGNGSEERKREPSGIIGPSQRRFKNPAPNPWRRNFDQWSPNSTGWSPTRTENNNHNAVKARAGNTRLPRPLSRLARKRTVFRTPHFRGYQPSSQCRLLATRRHSRPRRGMSASRS